jgi:uncharacterized sulfatase
MTSQKSTRRQFVKQGAALAVAFAIPAVALRGADSGSPSKRPDVLFLIAEDHQACLGCYGNPICKTPNLDALAARGVRFDRAYCQYPLCNPTRSSMLSGLRPETTQVVGNEQDWNEYLKAATTLPEFFHANGYETVRIGKIFHSGNGNRIFDDKARWDRVVPPQSATSKKPGKKAGKKADTKAGPSLRVLYDQFTEEERQKDYDMRAWVWGPLDVEDNQAGDGRKAEAAARVLQEKREKPLFLAVGFSLPHLSYRAPRKYFDMYPPERIPLPDYPENDLDDSPGPYSLRNHKQFTDVKRREAIAAYYACISYVDACAGRILDALKQSGRENDTIVVFWGDHGFNVGEHLLWQKMNLFEESCRVPLILAAPGVAKAGSVVRRPAEVVDMFPTLAELCGLTPPEGLECISMVPLLRNPERPWKKGAFTSRKPGRSIRTERWRYTEWGSPEKTELYDHQTDPKEITNLAKDPKYKTTVAELSQLLHAGWKACLPE